MPLLDSLIRQRKPVYLADVSHSPHWRAHLPGHDQGSWLGIPLMSGNELVGIFSLGSSKLDFFTAAHQQTLETVAAPIAQTLQTVLLWEWRHARNAQLSALTQRVLTVQEEERKHVSRELHDEAGQALTALAINLELLQQDLTGQSQALIDRAHDAVVLTYQTLQFLRNVASQLRPPALDSLGLDGALEQLCKDTARRTALPISFLAQDVVEPTDTASLALYRFVQEALTNVARHADASCVQVNVYRAGRELCVTVRDDGKGFDADAHLDNSRTGKLGLLGMRERLMLVGGWLEISSQPGMGSFLTARVPLEKQPQDG
ncbi:MAG: GAF domain-containing sensor histidine kinase [Chloroflexi bacterium]|nr:GAF domain-containing sensor histidine kinase [Chloroflexota bacterium]